jgi:hypothetical protein
MAVMQSPEATSSIIDPSNGILADESGAALRCALEAAAAVSRQGAIYFVFTNWTGVSNLTARVADIRSLLLDVVV